MFGVVSTSVSVLDFEKKITIYSIEALEIVFVVHKQLEFEQGISSLEVNCRNLWKIPGSERLRTIGCAPISKMTTIKY